MQNHLTPAEEQELMQYVKSEEFDEVIKNKISEYWQSADDTPFLPENKQNVILNRILFSEQTSTQLLQQTTTRKKKRYGMLAAASLLVLLLVAGGFFYLQKKTAFHQPPILALQGKKDIQPGKTGAILTLSDGSTIVLDSAREGALAKQNGANITKTAAGSLAYDVTTQTDPGTIAWNTITTPRGSQYEITLPDGTRVWLNAATSLQYPVAFVKGAERRVILSGEAYFEANSNEQSPFKVTVQTHHNNEGEVTALGTRFNIMAYDDEAAVHTTLLEGAVLVSRAGNSKRLVPGQQAIFPPENNNTILIENVDTEIAVAWKKGFFRFDQQKLPAIMRQVGRWYNVDISYEGRTPDIIFGGGIDKHLPLSRILGALEKYGLRFEVTDRKVNVLSTQSTNN
ncbi:MAG: FecR domain-containing protein [Chitinophaga sp.]|uniref:FecR family protein n=1 Tax=Chitinophaga sp. TaxID=1869181 RepID=UPI001B2E94FF|nr:FecR family protein [Chitinophaga sp.]MBO9727363.1 FecR domain-containing protein [Chitinophaga sp.]